MKLRLNDLARELDVKVKAILDVLEEVGVTEKKTHSSSIEEDEAERVRQYFLTKSNVVRKEGPSGEIRPRIDLSKISKPGDIARLLREREQQIRVPAPSSVPLARPPAWPVAVAPPKLIVSSPQESPSSEIRPRIDLSKISKLGDVARLLKEREQQLRVPVPSSVPPARPPAPPVAAPTPVAPPAVPARPVAISHSMVTPAITGTSLIDATSSMLTEALILPRNFTFHRKFVDFDHILGFFDWDYKDESLLIDLSLCESANYQAITLLIQYAWYLTLNGCKVTFKYGSERSGPTKMLRDMGALDWPEVLMTDGRDFGNAPGKKTYALRRRSDVPNTINSARRAITNYTVGFPDYLSYIVSELLYNATEHGQRMVELQHSVISVPSIFQFGNYPMLNRLSFFFSDLGIGIKTHLEQVYPSFPTHQEAIRHALNPNVSGTFRDQSRPYARQDNAGMGLTYSSSMLKRLQGDMYIVSHNGMVHISPEDITSRTLKYPWKGTFILINLNVSDAPAVSLKDMLAEIQVKAQKEIDSATEKEQSTKYYVGIYNYFGKWAEDKDAAITFRDRYLIPAIQEGKRIELDFHGVETAPHSFLNALLATPVRLLEFKTYQWIRVTNAPGSIHEIINTIIANNLPKME